MNRRRFVLTSVASMPSLTGWLRRCTLVPSTTPVAPATWSIVAADVGFGAPNGASQQGDLLFLRDDEGGTRRLYRAPWKETRGDRPLGGETPILLQDVARNATDPRVPIRDAPFFSDSARWMIWREGATVHAIASTGKRQAVKLHEIPHALLRPALQRAGGDVFVFALSADRTRIEQLRFPRAGSSPATIAASVVIGDAADSATAGFVGDTTRVATVRASSGTTVMQLLGFERAMTTRSVVVASATPVPESHPILAASTNGDVTVATLVSKEDGIAVAEATFPRDASAASIAVRTIGRLPALPIGGALLYQSTGTASRMLRAVVRIDAGTFARLNDAGVLERANYADPPVVPLILAPATRGALILCCDPASGPLMAEA